jgi:hypothetical protein
MSFPTESSVNQTAVCPHCGAQFEVELRGGMDLESDNIYVEGAYGITKLKAHRDRESYRDWKKIVEFLEGAPTLEQIVWFLHTLQNSKNRYGTATKAFSNLCSVILVLSERENKNIETHP